MTVAGLPTVQFNFDDANRLTQVAQGTTILSFGYDEANRRTSITWPNGIIGTFTFDDASQLMNIAYAKGATSVGTLGYGYDAAGRRTSVTGTLAGFVMPQAISTLNYNGSNRLDSSAGTALTYDSNGNLTNFGGAGYTWNARNQLIGTSDGGGSFSYDALGRRVGATVNGSSTQYLHDGLNPVTLSGNLQLSSQKLDEVFAQVSSGGTTSYLRDGLNSAVAVTNGSGAVTGNYAYSPYGESVRSGTGSTPLQYTGRDNDGATGLYYYRARYYSPALGRFISEDPIGINGDLNVYSYASGDPISNADPLGLWGVTVGGYRGWGMEFTFGRDSGHWFLTGRIGLGMGGGIAFDPFATVPGGADVTGCHGGGVLSASFEAGFNRGPFGGGFEFGALRNYGTNESHLFGGPKIALVPSLTGPFGWRNSISVGAQITMYGPRE